MAMHRRKALATTGALLVGGWYALQSAQAAGSPAIGFLDKSALIYLSPLRSDGGESRCHGEVWFIHHESEVYVVTRSDAWRAEALRRGLSRAAIWIGEFGPWKKAKDTYRSAPYLTLEGRLEPDTGVHATILSKFGEKYASEWGTWGPRFHDGLADGSRVLLRYGVAS